MQFNKINQYIRSIEINKEAESYPKYPFSIPAIRNLDKLEFHPKVTFIVGENGSGKSTLLESIAVGYGFNPEGGTKNFSFSTKDTHSELNKYLKIVKGVRLPKDGFFLRAESFYNVATYIEELDPALLNYYGGTSLHKQSHGESFISLVFNKFKGNGVYILDEPEAALSPSRQMSLLTKIHELVNENSQFIIATHSPILMAYPDSLIYQVDEKIKPVKYEETEHYQITKMFLNDTTKMLKILLE